MAKSSSKVAFLPINGATAASNSAGEKTVLPNTSTRFTLMVTPNCGGGVCGVSGGGSSGGGGVGVSDGVAGNGGRLGRVGSRTPGGILGLVCAN